MGPTRLPLSNPGGSFEIKNLLSIFQTIQIRLYRDILYHSKEKVHAATTFLTHNDEFWRPGGKGEFWRSG